MELYSATADTTLASQMNQESTNKCSSICWQISYIEETPTTKLHQIPEENCALCSSSNKEEDKKL
jgi:hypothetical protein